MEGLHFFFRFSIIKYYRTNSLLNHLLSHKSNNNNHRKRSHD